MDEIVKDENVSKEQIMTVNALSWLRLLAAYFQKQRAHVWSLSATAIHLNFTFFLYSILKNHMVAKMLR